MEGFGGVLGECRVKGKGVQNRGEGVIQARPQVCGGGGCAVLEKPVRPWLGWDMWWSPGFRGWTNSYGGAAARGWGLPMFGVGSGGVDLSLGSQ